MAVYVDKTFEWSGPHGFNRWCHMIADDLDELHAMARRLGMKQEWFQDKPNFPHYDLLPSSRSKAVKYGAVELNTRQEFMGKVKELRATKAWSDV